MSRVSSACANSFDFVLGRNKPVMKSIGSHTNLFATFIPFYSGASAALDYNACASRSGVAVIPRTREQMNSAIRNLHAEPPRANSPDARSEEHTSELQSPTNL